MDKYNQLIKALFLCSLLSLISWIITFNSGAELEIEHKIINIIGLFTRGFGMVLALFLWYRKYETTTYAVIYGLLFSYFVSSFVVLLSTPNANFDNSILIIVNIVLHGTTFIVMILGQFSNSIIVKHIKYIMLGLICLFGMTNILSVTDYLIYTIEMSEYILQNGESPFLHFGSYLLEMILVICTNILMLWLYPYVIGNEERFE